MAPADSEPLSYTCTCPALSTGGSVLLFYRYYHNDPPLTSPLIQGTTSPADAASFHENLANCLGLGGKLRFSTEGFNITVGGTASAIDSYTSACISHWSFSGLPLSTPAEQDAFFKPTPGCACVFGNRACVKVTAEITPLGITDYAPESWSSVTTLSPAAFHEMCVGSTTDLQLIDMRNHYESRIGYFVTGEGEIAVRPAIRRFSQWPGFVSRHLAGDAEGMGDKNFGLKKQLLTYCTGGIRCEKGARWMQEAMAGASNNGERHIYTLQGGIVAYLAWVKNEIEAGRKVREDCLFKGKNYVFDARGSIGMGLAEEQSNPVAVCQGCSTPEDRLSKCKNQRCHLVLVICEGCDDAGGVSCCEDCGATPAIAKGVCQCEKTREGLLWDGAGAKLWNKRRKREKLC